MTRCGRSGDILLSRSSIVLVKYDTQGIHTYERLSRSRRIRSALVSWRSIRQMRFANRPVGREIGKLIAWWGESVRGVLNFPFREVSPRPHRSRPSPLSPSL